MWKNLTINLLANPHNYRNELEKGLYYVWAEFPCKQMTIIVFPMSIVSTIITFFQFMNPFLGIHFKLPFKRMWWCGDVVPLFGKTKYVKVQFAIFDGFKMLSTVGR
jgi:hypothetical protein